MKLYIIIMSLLMQGQCDIVINTSEALGDIHSRA